MMDKDGIKDDFEREECCIQKQREDAWRVEGVK
jgi:hypothetical protein